jgi:D-glycero-D-manno-heptose 1,7-bisphosphate phosphatase
MRSGRRFVLLDRDGTLVRDPGYVHRIEEYALLPGVVAALRRLRDAGFAFAIVTNQGGIGRGLFSEEQYFGFARHLESDLSRQGIRIERTFHCPHGSDAGCPCRKPAPGLFFRASLELGIDLSRSFAVGDAPRDATAALAAGCAGAVRLVGDERFGASACERLAYARDLPGAADRILARPH